MKKLAFDSQSIKSLKIFFLINCCIFIALSAAVNVAWAAPVSEFEEQDVKVSLQQSADENFHLVLSSLSSGELTSSVFVLSAPPRLVVDLSGANKGKGNSRTIEVANSAISAVRIGVHPDKIRFVIDLKGTATPSYSQSGSGSKISVDFNLAGLAPVEAKEEVEVEATETKNTEQTPAPTTHSTATRISNSQAGLEVTAKLPEQTEAEDYPAGQVKRLEEPNAAPQKPAKKIIYDPPIAERENSFEDLVQRRPATGKVVEEAKEPALSVKEQAAKSAKTSTEVVVKETTKPEQAVEQKQTSNQLQITKKIEPGKMANTEPKPTVVQSKVEGLFYKMLNNSTPALMIKVSSLGEYSFRQRDKNIFEVVLNNSQLAGDHLTQPHFPGEEFKGLEGTFMWQRDNSVVIKIYVEEGVRLSPYSAEGNLWVKVAN